jgi:hypothetical protein
VVPARPAEMSAAYDKTRDELQKALADDLIQEYVAALQKDKGVRVNTALIEQQLQK